MRRKCSWFNVVAVAGVLALSGCRSPEQKMSNFMAEGKKFASQGDYKSALIQFKNASQIKPKDPEPYYQSGMAFAAQRDWTDAARSLQKALTLNPSHVGAKLALAELEASTADRTIVELGEKQLQELLTAAPDNPEVLTALAAADWRLARREEAKQHIEEAFEKFPNNLAAAGTLAKLKMSKGDFAGAEEVLKKTASQTPPNANAVAALGSFYALRKNDAEAEVQLRKALQIEPTNASALFSLAALQVREGKNDVAEQTYQQLAKVGPNYRFIYGQFLRSEGKQDAAIAEFERMFKADPKDREVRTILVETLYAANRFQDAEKILSEAIRKNAKDVDALLLRSTLSIRAHRYAEARADLTEVMRNQNSAKVQYLLSRVDAGEGKTLARQEHLSEAVRLQPRFLAARLELAQLMLAAKAGRAAQTVVDAIPQDQKDLPEVAAMRSWTLISTGQSGEARKLTEAALAKARTPDLLQLEAIFKAGDHQFDEAGKLLHEAIDKSPANVKLLESLLQIYNLQRRAPAAIDEIKGYASKWPNSVPVQILLSDLLRSTGDHAGAVAVLNNSKATNPANTDIDFYLSRLLRDEGKTDEAIRELNTVLNADANNRPALLWRGNIETGKADYTAAAADYKRLLDLDSDNTQALNNLSFVLSEYLHQPDEALKYAQKALELNPGDPATQDTLGWVMYRKGLYDLSIKQLEAAAQKPGNAVWKYHLAMAYAKTGQPTKAQAAFDAASRINANLPEASEAKELLSHGKAR